MNTVIIVGRIKEIKTTDKGTQFILSVNRPYKEGKEYKQDDIKVLSTIKNELIEEVKIGDVIGIKGAIYNNENGMYVYADRITFLKSNSEKKGE